ncbi:hypothetical protein [Solirubrobacter soli]|uniref:hypothetical protein n=1 Tax=Solirubrobacter soli TaxID=363832 RepID=UPI000481DBF5|nr:hypothetical protein [Solirubrobacter soli]
MPFFRIALLALVVLVAGCGGNDPAPTSASAPTATPAAAKTASSVPTVTSAADVAACGLLEQTIQAVSQLVGHTTEGITQALNPKDLAKQVGTARKSLLDSAKLVEIVKAQEPLAGPQREFVTGLRMFAADFARGKTAAAKGDMASATQLLTDEKALRKIQESAKRIDQLCGR